MASGKRDAASPWMSLPQISSDAVTTPQPGTPNETLIALGERMRDLRARRGMTRKAVAIAAGVSERHLASTEHGHNNCSILVLQKIAAALHCSLAELLGDITASTPEWLQLRELLQHRPEADLRRARLALGEQIGGATPDPRRGRRIALIGMRGAGKYTWVNCLQGNCRCHSLS